MNAITQLWMPILATAVLIFIASSLIHMVFKWHNSDYRQLGNEDAVRAALGANQPGPGQYIVPYCADMKEMQGETMMKKYIDGPVAWITVLKNGAPNMGKSLALWFVYTLLIAAFAGWLALQSYGAGANSRLAAHLVGMVSFLAYASGSVQLGIWMGKPLASVAKDVLDGAIYGTISALVFMWLWP